MNATFSAAGLPAGQVRLDDWGLIRARGADAATFLHGQLTQDIQHLGDGSARLAGYCSAKGRLLASFVVWRRAPDDILLACSADLLPAVLKRLSMFVLRAQCKLSDASADVPLWGLAGDAAKVAPAADWARTTASGSDVIRLPAALVDGHTVPRALWAGAEAPPGPPMEGSAWRWLEVHSGVARVLAATADQFVPQMVNLELVGGVNFQKGCYPGQEVVARSQYRGTLKRRGYVLEGDTALAPGEEVFHSEDPGQPAGVVALAGHWLQRHAALVQLKVAAVEAGTLHAHAPHGPLLAAGHLPYALPAEAA